MNLTAQAQKSVHLIPKDAAIKRLCFDDATQRLRPNLVLVDRQGSVVFEINELGLKGAARDPMRKLFRCADLAVSGTVTAMISRLGKEPNDSSLASGRNLCLQLASLAARCTASSSRISVNAQIT
jgi:hypothetical protein